MKKPVSLQVGRLGMLTLPVCTCVYTGSARKHIEARIARHLRRKKTLRWHIDYLLVHPDIEVLEVLQFTAPECEVNQSVTGTVALKGFGSSDCTAGCVSHLKVLTDSP